MRCHLSVSGVIATPADAAKDGSIGKANSPLAREALDRSARRSERLFCTARYARRFSDTAAFHVPVLRQGHAS